jgi:hypothetical protein
VNRILPFKKESGLFNDKEPGWRGESAAGDTKTGALQITGALNLFFSQNNYRASGET